MENLIDDMANMITVAALEGRITDNEINPPEGKEIYVCIVSTRKRTRPGQPRSLAEVSTVMVKAENKELAKLAALAIKQPLYPLDQYVSLQVVVDGYSIDKIHHLLTSENPADKDDSVLNADALM